MTIFLIKKNMGHLFFQSKSTLIFLQNQDYFVIHQEEQAFLIESEQNTVRTF